MEFVYNRGQNDIGKGLVKFNTDTFRIMLVAGYTPNIDLHATFNDVAAFEVTGAGYTSGGALLSNVTWARDDVLDRSVFNANDVVFTNYGGPQPSHAIVYDVTNNNVLLFAWTVSTIPLGGDYTARWSTNGIGVATLAKGA